MEKALEKVLVSKRLQKEYFIRKIEQDYHCADGFVQRDMLQLQDGSIVTTNTGKEFNLLTSTFIDRYKRIKRLAQIIPRKDIGIILSETGVGKKSIVADMGAGSGALALMLAQFVKKVFTYDIREDHLELVRKNSVMLGIKNIIPMLHDVYTGIPAKMVDLITLDLPEPWKMLEHIEKCLVIGHFAVSYSPTIPQVMDFVAAVQKNNSFMHEKTVEVMLREWEVDERKVRPRSTMMGHSGFLTIIRRIK